VREAVSTGTLNVGRIPLDGKAGLCTSSISETLAVVQWPSCTGSFSSVSPVFYTDVLSGWDSSTSFCLRFLLGVGWSKILIWQFAGRRGPTISRACKSKLFDFKKFGPCFVPSQSFLVLSRLRLGGLRIFFFFFARRWTLRTS